MTAPVRIRGVDTRHLAPLGERLTDEAIDWDAEDLAETDRIDPREYVGARGLGDLR